MASCKFRVAIGTTGRYVKTCGADTRTALIFTTQLDTDYLVTTQLPVCSEHYKDKTQYLTEMGLSWQPIRLS